MSPWFDRLLAAMSGKAPAPQFMEICTPPMTYCSVPPYRSYAMRLPSAEPLRYTVFETLKEAVGDLARFQLPFIPLRSACVVDSENQIVLGYSANQEDNSDVEFDLIATYEALDELVPYVPADVASLWEAQAALGMTVDAPRES